MTILKSAKACLWAVILSVVLVACDSAEERAEERYQSGLALMEEGDFDRAIVAFRSVFELNGRHLGARRKLAELILNHQGNLQGAYGEYLRLAEQEPDDLETRLVLSELAFSVSNWDELERHAAKAEELSPEEPRVQALVLARGYRTAALDEDAPARREIAGQAEAMTAAQPENQVLRSIMVDNYLRDGAMREALASIDWLLERKPDDARAWRQRMNVLARLQDYDALEAQLQDMVTRFADDDSHKTTLIRFYMSRQQPDKAEAFLRQLAAEGGAENIGPRVDLIRFLIAVRGADAGRAEIDAAIADFPDEVRFKVLQAGMDYTAGQRDQAIRTLEAVLESAEPSEQTRTVKVTLARMLLGAGNEVGARARVEEVLAEEPTEPEALKMMAAWQIEADDTDNAISGLRVALDQRPEDTAALTLMAQAYTRSGRPELARDFLALAVDASGNAPEETVRYARVLLREERYRAAEDILLPALRLDNDNVGLLLALGQLYLGMEDLGRAQQVISTLSNIDDPRAQEAATGLEAERINQQSGTAEAMTYLEEVANSADASLTSQIALVRARLRTGDPEGALEMARELQAEAPGDDRLLAVLAMIEGINGNLDTAEEIYNRLLEENPQRPGIWLELSRLKARQGDPEASEDMIARALELMPDDVNLMWAQASNLERNGDIEGAIAIYDGLYERNSNSAVIANNLASLISTYRTDQESLDRAWTIARRFSETDVPALQDTYGWILHRRGETEEALPYLEAAAQALASEPLVQFHLAEAYAALERYDAALAQYRAAVEAAGPGDSREQLIKARAQITELQSRAEAEVESATQDQ